MPTFLVVVQAQHQDQLAAHLKSRRGDSPPPEGVTQVHATAWTVEVPKCSEFFANLLHDVGQLGRAYVVAQLAEGTDPYVHQTTQ